MGFYTDISLESRCKIEIHVWAHFYKILLVFEVPYWPRVKEMPGKKLKLPKVGKHTSNLASLYVSHIDAIIIMKQICLGLARNTKILLKWAQTLISLLHSGSQKMSAENPISKHSVGEREKGSKEFRNVLT